MAKERLIIIATADQRIVEEYADRLIKLLNGKIEKDKKFREEVPSISFVGKQERRNIRLNLRYTFQMAKNNIIKSLFNGAWCQ